MDFVIEIMIDLSYSKFISAFVEQADRQKRHSRLRISTNLFFILVFSFYRLACFFAGPSSCLVASISNAAMTLFLVASGSMISST